MQIVGRTYEDGSVLHAALAYEAANSWIDKHPPI
jgi:Asp-tRNA(Asn)/Glu-tRNA(Gln) amidotransferase A subunit family amidase